MNTIEFIPIDTLCTQYAVEYSFFDGLNEHGLISIQSIEEHPCLHLDSIAVVEKTLRLHQDLQIKIDDFDIIFNLLQQIESLKEELQTVKNRLRRYEDFG